MKHGYGVQVWKDGAKYEGNWRLNKACGHGKFWHVDGDVFEGRDFDVGKLQQIIRYDAEKEDGEKAKVHGLGR